ncbi:Gamma-glutamyl phosphate reductase [Clavibacter michiganensis subsp. michiganensis]|nr:Gamma-glutamyl phosphate reductase [Clavibacter michiganensis subsp. michiganensis]
MPSNVPAAPITTAEVLPADELERILEAARTASTSLAASTSVQRDAALDAIAAALVSGADRIVAANAEDLAAGRDAGLAAGLLDRLTLDARRVASLADAVTGIRGLDDPSASSSAAARSRTDCCSPRCASPSASSARSTKPAPT